MDDETLTKFAAYCRLHKITFAIHKDRSGAFRLNFSAEDDKDIQELLRFLKKEGYDDQTTKQQLPD